MFGDESRVFRGEVRAGGELTLLNILRSGFLSLCPEFISDLLRTAFFFEEFALGLHRPAFCFYRSIWIRNYPINDPRYLDQ